MENRILLKVEGSHKSGLLNAPGTRNIVISDDRIEVIETLIFSCKKTIIKYDQIAQIEIKTNLINSDITIINTGGTESIHVYKISPIVAEKAAKLIREKIADVKVAHNDPRSNASQGNYLDDLLKLAKLKEQGIVTEEEFNLQKVRLLSSNLADNTNSGNKAQGEIAGEGRLEESGEINEAIFAGHKIEAINLYRGFSGVGLAEAKAIIEEKAAKLYAKHPEKFSSPPVQGCAVGLLVMVALAIGFIYCTRYC